MAGFAHWASPRRGTAKRGVSGHRNDRVNLHWDADPGDLSVCGKGGLGPRALWEHCGRGGRSYRGRR